MGGWWVSGGLGRRHFVPDAVRTATFPKTPRDVHPTKMATFYGTGHPGTAGGYATHGSPEDWGDTIVLTGL